MRSAAQAHDSCCSPLGGAVSASVPKHTDRWLPAAVIEGVPSPAASLLEGAAAALVCTVLGEHSPCRQKVSEPAGQRSEQQTRLTAARICSHHAIGIAFWLGGAASTMVLLFRPLPADPRRNTTTWWAASAAISRRLLIPRARSWWAKSFASPPACSVAFDVDVLDSSPGGASQPHRWPTAADGSESPVLRCHPRDLLGCNRSAPSLAFPFLSRRRRFWLPRS